LDGLDTFATAKFNGKEILKSDNMFIPHRVDITGHLKRDGDNVLEIDFEPALLKARYLVASIRLRWRSDPNYIWPTEKS